MQFWRDGRRINVDRVRYRELGYRREVLRSEVEDVFAVEVDVDRDEFVSALDGPFKALVREARQEHRQTGEFDPEFLEETGFVELGCLAERWPKHCSELVVDYLFFELLGALFSNQPGGRTSFVINSIDSVQVFATFVRLHTTVFSPR